MEQDDLKQDEIKEEDLKTVGDLKSIGLIMTEDLSPEEVEAMNYMALKEASEFAKVSKMTVYRFAQKLANHENPEIRKLLKTIKDDNPRDFKIYIHKPTAEKHFKNWVKGVSIEAKIKEVEEDIKKPNFEEVQQTKEEVKETISETSKHTERLIDVLERELNSKDEIIKELTLTLRGINQTLQQTNFLLTTGRKREEEVKEEIKPEETEEIKP